MEEYEIAKYAVDAYSHLLPMNGRYSGADLAHYIEIAYEMNARRRIECDAVERCVLEIKKYYSEIRVKISRR